MAHKHLFICIFCLGGILGAGTLSFGAWQADQPAPAGPAASPFSLETPPAEQPQQVNTSATSPFSLENDASSASPDTTKVTVPPASQSPFALPENSGQDAAPSHDAADSPFALPDSKPGGAAGGFQPERAGAGAAQLKKSAQELLEEGLQLAKAGKLEEARVALSMSVLKDSKNVVTINNLGLVQRKLGLLDDALTSYQYALQVDETYALTYKNIGVLLEKRGEKELAIKAYREYARLAPDAKDAKNVAARADWLEQNR